ncbi:hypothetical protein C4K23_0789 [Pseudomonas chlororaphis]|nr:hypothetical protein C4K23_0789 [Pseudomonas chlororaphis]
MCFLIVYRWKIVVIGGQQGFVRRCVSAARAIAETISSD